MVQQRVRYSKQTKTMMKDYTSPRRDEPGAVVIQANGPRTRMASPAGSVMKVAEMASLKASNMHTERSKSRGSNSSLTRANKPYMTSSRV